MTANCSLTALARSAPTRRGQRAGMGAPALMPWSLIGAGMPSHRRCRVESKGNFRPGRDSMTETDV
jgi:hypothetical protein